MLLPRRTAAIASSSFIVAMALWAGPAALSSPKDPKEGAGRATVTTAPVAATVTTLPATTTTVTLPVPSPADVAEGVPGGVPGGGPPTGVPPTGVPGEGPPSDPGPPETPPGLEDPPEVDPQPSAVPSVVPPVEPSPSVSPSPTPDPLEPEGDLELTTSAKELLVQLGGEAHYSVNVTNPGPGVMKGLIVVAEAPQELDLEGVPIVPGVAAATLNRSPDGEDIVWVLDPLRPGASIELPWSGTAVRPGDLRAEASVRAFTDAPEGPSEEADAVTFLATVDEPPARNPEPHVQKRVVSYRSVTLPAPPPAPRYVPPPPPEAAQGAPGSLPNTGTDPVPLLAGGIFLILIGSFFAFGPKVRHRADPRALAVVMLVLLGACVASQPDVEEGPDEAKAPVTQPEPSPSPEDEVKGIRIRKGDGKTGAAGTGGEDGAAGNGQDGGESGGEATTPTTTIPVIAVVPDAPTRTILVREVEVVEVPVESLPQDVLQTRPADNTVTLEWSEASGIRSAASSVLISPDTGVEMLTSVSEGAGRTIHVDVTLRNTAPATRITVRGRILHQVSGQGGGATLRSEPLDVVLNPGGEASEEFSYLLPAGSYTLQSLFQAD